MHRSGRNNQKPRGNKWVCDMPSKRVSFKQTRAGRGKDTFDKVHVIRNLDLYEEDGIDTSDFLPARGSHGGHNKKYNRGGRNRAGSPAPQKRLYNSPMSWYRVYIPYGNKYEKPYLLKRLLDSIAPSPLQPYMWNVDGRAVTFYVEDFAVAEKLHQLHKELEMPDGFRLYIRVSPDTPNIDVDDTLREKMKAVMGKRYNAALKALDMTRFHADPDLADAFCPLFKPVVSLAAINIIAENIPELEALNLNDNSIQVVNHLKDLPKKLPNLKSLHLARNKLKTINHLDTFVGLPLVELVLDGNYLCDNFKDQPSYISEIRKRFPKLLVLDGVDLPPPISFDVEEVSMPASKSTFLCSDEGQVVVRQFLAQYFEILDSDNREPLLHAYHENAMMSCTMSYGYNKNPKNSPQLNWYNTDNRNLDRVTDPERRRKLLKQGHLAVVAFHQEMPPTKHDFNSFAVDLTLFTPQMVCLNVGGVFKETRTGKKMAALRHFNRAFVIIPCGTGFCIINEMLHVTNASEEEIDQAFKTPVILPSTSTSQEMSDVAAPLPVAPMGALPIADVTKQQMIEALMRASGMNADWSQKCLEETAWDYQRAEFAFNEAKAQGHIPPEAYAK